MTVDRSKRATGQNHIVDTHVGLRLRGLRTVMGLSQTDLANKLGITFQQIQKYEKGNNRISASRLYEIAVQLGVEPSYFFDEMDGAVENMLRQDGEDKLAEETAEYMPASKLISGLEALRLVGAFYSIKDENVRDKIAKMVKAMARAEGAILAEDLE